MRVVCVNVLKHMLTGGGNCTSMWIILATQLCICSKVGQVLGARLWAVVCACTKVNLHNVVKFLM